MHIFSDKNSDSNNTLDFFLNHEKISVYRDLLKGGAAPYLLGRDLLLKRLGVFREAVQN